MSEAGPLWKHPLEFRREWAPDPFHMSSATPPSPANTISSERLNQIAGKKLSALGVQVRLAADRRLLEGELLFKTAQVLYPGTEQPIPRARFMVRGHDHLRFNEPPLSALGDVLFYDLDTPTALEERLGQKLRQRMQELERAAAELKRLRLPYKLDSQRLGLRTVVKTAQFSFELVAFPTEARVVRVEPSSGPGFDVAQEHAALRLADFRLLVDLELFLSTDVDRMLRPPTVTPHTVPAVKVEPLPPQAGQLTLGMLVQRLGADTVLSPTSKLELFQDFLVGATRYRLSLVREDGVVFRASLSDGVEEQRTERVDASKSLGATKLVAGWLQPLGASPTPEPASSVLAHPMPTPGEVWVMNVLIEEDAADEIRYVCIDTDGKPYGASRILRRQDFESAFVRHLRGGWRLLIQIDDVEAENVVYRQLDGHRQPRGQARKLAVAVLVATFLPELDVE